MPARKPPKTSRKNSLGIWGLALFIVIAIIPIMFSLGYALAYSLGVVGLLSEGVTGAYWARLFTEPAIWASFGLSIYIALVTVVLTISLALTVALYLRRPLQRGALSYAIYFPLAIPATVAAFLVFQVFTGAGLASRLLIELGVINDIVQFPDLVNDTFGIGIIMAHVSLAVPFFVLLFVQIYNTEHLTELTQLSQTLGANRWHALYKVSVPILLSKSYTNIILLFILVLGSYEIPLLLGRQAPQMVSVLTMRKYAMFDIAQKPEAFIVAILYTLLVLGLILVAFRKGRMGYDL